MYVCTYFFLVFLWLVSCQCFSVWTLLGPWHRTSPSLYMDRCCSKEYKPILNLYTQQMVWGSMVEGCSNNPTQSSILGRLFGILWHCQTLVGTLWYFNSYSHLFLGALLAFRQPFILAYSHLVHTLPERTTRAMCLWYEHARTAHVRSTTIPIRNEDPGMNPRA